MNLDCLRAVGVSFVEVLVGEISTYVCPIDKLVVKVCAQCCSKFKRNSLKSHFVLLILIKVTVGRLRGCRRHLELGNANSTVACKAPEFGTLVPKTKSGLHNVTSWDFIAG